MKYASKADIISFLNNETGVPKHKCNSILNELVHDAIGGCANDDCTQFVVVTIDGRGEAFSAHAVVLLEYPHRIVAAFFEAPSGR